MLSLNQFIALLLTITAVLAWANRRFIGLPVSIGLLVLGLSASLLLVALHALAPGLSFPTDLARTVDAINFNETLMNGMLGFLLFAGALHVDWQGLKGRGLSVGLMATFGVLISTVIVGSAFYGILSFAGVPISYSWALVFGALISPTDPVAVLATLKAVQVPKRLELDMAGESLFNDGVGVVVFTILLTFATADSTGETPGVADVAELFVVEALGGAAFGFAMGYIAYRMMHAIDEFAVEVLISLALVMGTYTAAQSLHLSGPISVVVAGLLIGERGFAYAMSETTQRYITGFWLLIDEILNAFLFMLIGLELLVIEFEIGRIYLALTAIPIVLLARFFSVLLPFQVVRLRESFSPGTVAVLVWGGVRGGISVALALSLPSGPERDLIVTATYVVVIFSILVQGLTLARLVRRVVRPDEGGEAAAAH
ncbi:cation:proton antiporter [Consotaella salsifontis]|uniref:Sodium/proton antiporter, CPA1 family n=1 Tax=Consotaella salsifontis TaxID=1365950 RepID=A0A1T4RXD9_9HYPH|nr:sodium:proton antiporter [Consotaella salsifontis]SKA20650.1 sodium/proton antiporter, CPA1 family [Consotaella salsifontis]